MKRNMVPLLSVVVAGALLFTGLTGSEKLWAGDLEPAAPPSPSMHTLEQIYQKPLWRIDSLKFKDWPTNTRFMVSYEQEEGGRLYWTDVVLDKETGLLWERTPDANASTWYSAYSMALQKVVGGRCGWRLPTMEEFLTLVDPNSATMLPAGHPFLNYQTSASYWSGTTVPSSDPNSKKAFVLIFPEEGGMGGFWAIDKSNGENRYKWCVRGGNGHDGY